MKRYFILIGVIMISLNLIAQQDTIQKDFFDMTLEELMNIEVDVATRFKSTIDESPNIVTVIERKTIEMSCAQTLADIIRFIPGLDISKGSLGWGEPLDEYYSRGIVNDFSQTILILLNGNNKFNDLTYASPFMSTRINVDMIERIEVIRGPGSALYGGNAFAAVINIITRDVGDKPETVFELSGQYPYATSLYGLTKNKLFKTDWKLGLQGKFFYDKGITYNSVQTDKIFTGQEVQNSNQITDGINPSYDVSANITSPNNVFRMQLWHTEHNPHPFLTGFFPQPNNDNYKYQGKQSLANFDLAPIKNLKISGYYSLMKWDSRLTLYWDSLIRTTQPTYQQDDLYGTSETNILAQIEANYNITFHNHNLLIGTTFLREAQINPTSTYWNGTEEQIYTEKDTAYVSYLPMTRYTTSAYLQDYWTISKKIIITIGLRFDYYNNLKDNLIFNPRVALLWNISKNNKMKFLYGEAFRPPSGFETNGVLYPLTGNPNLKPEKIRTGEVAYINYSDFARLQINFFANYVENSIGISDNGNYSNQGNVFAYGGEFELQGKFWWINYSYVSSVTMNDETNNERSTYFIAPHSVNAGIYYSFYNKKFTIRNQISYRSPRENFTGEKTKSQYFNDISIDYKLKKFSFVVGCRNLFNQKWEMPLNDGGFYSYPYRGSEIFIKTIVKL